MKSCRGFSNTGLLTRISVFLLLLVIAVLSGLYLGKMSVPGTPVGTPAQVSRTPAATARQNTDPNGDIEDTPDPLADIPIFLHVGGTAQENWSVTRSQLELAAETGVHQYVVPMALSWSDAEGETPSYSSLLEPYMEVNERAKLLLRINLNPPVTWLERHPEAAIVINETLQAYPSINAAVWLETAKQRLESLIYEVESGPYGDAIIGYGVTALADQRWMLTSDFDESEANKAGFRSWLQQVYTNEDTLQYNWGRDDSTFATASIPRRPENGDSCTFLAILPEQQPLVDFYRYCSEQVALTIAGFASQIAQVSTIVEPLIVAPYGYTYEALESASGHFGLELLLDSDLTGLVSPVSYFDRGLGGVGGMMGALDSLQVRGKTWYLVDDTRTGVERNEDTGEFERIRGIRVEDVYEVQQRNFAMAVTYGLGLIWSDPQGEGWLNDEDQWLQFGELLDIYADYQQDDGPDAYYEPAATLTVVVDELSNCYLQCTEHVNALLLQQGRDAALRTGVTTRFHLLRDVIEGVAPPTPVYLFLNAFHLSGEDRARLHSRLAIEEASAIWLYAPGYFGTTGSVENISLTTGMDVRVFEEPTQTGSTYILSGHFMQTDQPFGTRELWHPLFYLEPDEDIDFLAKYMADNEKGSAAIVTLSEGWTSVYIAEPELTPALLSEILLLLEQHVFPSPMEEKHFDAIFARDGLFTVHASRAGKRSFQFEHFYDIKDLFDPTIGWFQKDSILMPLRTGETRLLLQQELRLGES